MNYFWGVTTVAKRSHLVDWYENKPLNPTTPGSFVTVLSFITYQTHTAALKHFTDGQ